MHKDLEEGLNTFKLCKCWAAVTRSNLTSLSHSLSFFRPFLFADQPTQTVKHLSFEKPTYPPRPPDPKEGGKTHLLAYARAFQSNKEAHVLLGRGTCDAIPLQLETKAESISTKKKKKNLPPGGNSKDGQMVNWPWSIKSS